MSLVAHYIKTTSGLWYKDLVIYGENWYLCFDDDDPPEIVIKKQKSIPRKERKEIICRCLNSVKISVKILSHSDQGERLFPPEYKRFSPAIQGFVKITGKIDLTNLTYLSTKSFKSNPEYQGVFYDFSG